mmetsp:Transcript_10110/g.22304  ORF Transcript_10110/g.22304 Transcript_10110/m.22304 type:complete len:89 (+) Transcript_10110:149-415(+)
MRTWAQAISSLRRFLCLPRERTIGFFTEAGWRLFVLCSDSGGVVRGLAHRRRGALRSGEFRRDAWGLASLRFYGCMGSNVQYYSLEKS